MIKPLERCRGVSSSTSVERVAKVKDGMMEERIWRRIHLWRVVLMKDVMMRRC